MSWSPATQGLPKASQGPAWPDRPDSGSLNELREADSPEAGRPGGQPSAGGSGSLAPHLEKQTRLCAAGLLGPAAGRAPAGSAWGHRRPAGQALGRLPRESGEPRGGYAEHRPGTQSPSWARRAPSRHAEPVPGTQSTVPARRARPGHAEHRPGPCQALCLSAEGRCLHGSDRGHSSRRQCPEARGVHTARETPWGAALVLGRGRGVQKAMRRLWGCRRGPPSVGLLGGQALTLSGVCSLPHAALSLREMHPLPTGAQAEARDAPPPPGIPSDSSWHPPPLHLAAWSFLLQLVVHTPASCLPPDKSHPRGPALTTPQPSFLRPQHGD